MSLFQRSVQKEAIRKLSSSKIAQAYQAFKQQFGDPVFQEKVRAAKEEQYQEGFLNDLFVKVLGYTLHPQPHFNLITEQKNLKNAKKADGAILREGKPIAVIELKSMHTIDLQIIEIQAFAYKNNQPTARYVITSNFQKLRFYMDHAVDFEEFDLFTLDETDFGLLYACLHVEQLLADVPAQLKAASLQKETQITHQLYLDYSKFKTELYTELRRWNRQHDALTLFKKSQKLLDRFLFFCFAEDKGLLKHNTLSDIIKQWNGLKGYDEYKPLYAIFKKYFNYLNNGHNTPHLTIFAYNGGLFAPDPLLDGLTIPDNLLQNHILTLSNYDFDSEVDTNILGHIFEHSLNELDEKTAQAIGQTADKSKTKRKKEGIFYTPRYITQYIVEQTIGALCQQKQIELAIDRLDWWDDCPSSVAIMRLHTYRGWLLQLTVLDPACGSGAFLNQAFVFLRAEHRNIDAMLATLTDQSVENTDWSTSILDHNLFGVDINEESVEIAKLSLWLRTAKVGRKLNDLSANIQVGNSLISDPEVAGDLAFDWQKAFPQVFEKGGFDVVIGNPPYGAKIPKEHIDFLIKEYNLFGISKSFSDTYFIFTIKGLESLLKQNGLLSFIMPNSWRLIETGAPFRKALFSHFNFIKIVQHAEKVFTDATVDCDTIVVKKCFSKIHQVSLIKQNIETIISQFEMDQERLMENNYVHLEVSTLQRLLVNKIVSISVLVKEILSVKNGVKPYEKGKGKPPQTEETMRLKPFTSTTKQNDTFFPLIGGSSFHKYVNYWKQDDYISYGNWLAAPRDKKIFFEEAEKLIFRQTSDQLIGTFISNGFVMRNNTHILLKLNNDFDLKYILALLNSKLLNFIYWTINPEKGEILAEVKAFHLGLMPIKRLSVIEQQPFIDFSTKMLSLNAELQTAQTDFLNLLRDSFPKLTVNKAVENWHESDFAMLKKTMEKQKGVFIDDLNGVKKWRKQFDLEKTAYQTLQQQIAATDKAIDAAVYALYELTLEEIQLIENQ